MSIHCSNRLSLSMLVGLMALCALFPSDMLAVSPVKVDTTTGRPVHAIVLQESDYLYGWPNLSYQEKKVEALVRLLGEFGVDVQRYVNGTNREVAGAIKEFFRIRKDEHPLLLVVYFGHTYQDEKRRSCLIPSDVLLPTEWKGASEKGIIPFRKLVSKALQSQTDSVFFINSSVSLASESELDFSRQEKAPSCLVVAPGQQGEAIPAQSHFVDILLKALKKKPSTNKQINLAGLCRLLVYKGMHNSWRMPWYEIFHNTRKSSNDKWLLLKSGKNVERRSKLTILTDSNDAVVRILNIKPKYEQDGMELSPGKYLVEITANDIKKKKWIRLVKGEHVFLSIPFKRSNPLSDTGVQVKDEAGVIKKAGSSSFLELYGFSLVKVEHGEFIMGGSRFNEGPKHSVLIKKDFSIMDREVSVELYGQYLKATGKRVAFDYGVGPDYPAVNVSWSAAREFAQWLSRVTGKRFRLPTEAEWEYVAGKTSKYVSAEQFKKLVPVDEAMVNQLGIRGMLGNVWEWCVDCWHQRYVREDSRGSNIDDCNNRVIRGGSWRNNIRLISPTSRNGISYKTRADNIGFRLIAE